MTIKYVEDVLSRPAPSLHVFQRCCWPSDYYWS